MKRIGNTQIQILAILVDRQRRGMLPPTIRELGTMLNIWTNAVQKHLQALRHRGLVTWENERRRTLRTNVEFFAADEVMAPVECA